MEEPVTFKNNSNQTLFGVIHIPSQRTREKRRNGVHILNPGLKNRVAPNRFNVKIARTLCGLGYPVLRSDPHGIGDSEGRLGDVNASVLDLWLKIQKGALVEDTLTWNDFFHRRVGLKSLTLVGQCGAGVTALLAAARDKRVDRLILVDTPFRTVPTGQEADLIAEDYAGSGQILLEGVSNVFQWTKLKKLLTLQVNWKLYLRALGSWVSNHRLGRALGKAPAVHERFNWPMAEAFHVLVKRGVRICFLYAENDFSLKEFSSDFQPHFLEPAKGSQLSCSFHIIPHANHIYAEPEWQEELVQQMRNWIAANPDPRSSKT